ncbi:MAG: hypothetical protein ACT4QC_11130 [Planctomycetaceae bacterium]
MPVCDSGSNDIRPTIQSPLGETLLRLQQILDRTRASEGAAQGQFAAWQQRWSSRREQVSRRLELIDRQLAALRQEDPEPRPHLSVVGVAPRDEGE